MFHLIVRQSSKPQAKNQKVGIVDRFHSRNVGLVVRFDRAAGRLDRKQHSALESVADRKNLAEHWHRLLAAVLVIARDQDDMLARAGSVFTLIGTPELFVGVG